MGDKKPNCEDLFDSKKVYNKIGPDYKLRVTESRKQQMTFVQKIFNFNSDCENYYLLAYLL